MSSSIVGLECRGRANARTLLSARFVRSVSLLGVAAALLSGTGSQCQDSRLPIKPDGNDARGPIDVLSDTKGLNVKPYLKRVAGIVKANWHLLIPDIARQPRLEQGHVAIDFRVTKDGRIKDIKYHETSEDPKLDRAAYGAITGFGGLPSLPEDFPCESIALRFHFYYNESPGDIAGGAEARELDEHVLPCVTSKVIPIGEPVLKISPSSISVAAGTKTQFYGRIDGVIDAAVAWSIAGPGCEGQACGVISAEGLYTAPVKTPNPATITVTVTSTVVPTQSDFSTVSIVAARDSH
jgi:TonB family protein